MEPKEFVVCPTGGRRGEDEHQGLKRAMKDFTHISKNGSCVNGKTILG